MGIRTNRRRSTPSTIVFGRWLVVVTLLAFVGLLALVSMAPAAHAAGNAGVVRTDQVGWVHVARSQIQCFRAPCPVSRYAAYRWTGRAWATTSLAANTQVYVSPYAAGWHWAWTQQTGWLVVASRDLTAG